MIDQIHLESEDIAGKSYWEDIWNASNIFPPVNPRDHGWSNYHNRQLHRFFSRNILKHSSTVTRLIELGCANSSWMPYFASEYNLEVWGLDYTEIGCKVSREIMRRANLSMSNIVCGDLFHPPNIGRFDIVISFGLVEHFTDTVAVIRACSEYLSPSGLIITIIPNMRCIPGFLQKKLGRKIYDKHVPLSLSMLQQSHRDAGLEEVDSAYISLFSFGLTNIQSCSPSMKLFLDKWGHRASVALGALYEHGLPFKPNRFTSPTIACIFRKGQ